MSVSLEEMREVEGLIVIQSDTEDESISYIIFELLNIFAKSNSFICQNSDIRDEDNCTERGSILCTADSLYVQARSRYENGH